MLVPESAFAAMAGGTFLLKRGHPSPLWHWSLREATGNDNLVAIILNVSVALTAQTFRSFGTDLRACVKYPDNRPNGTDSAVPKNTGFRLPYSCLRASSDISRHPPRTKSGKFPEDTYKIESSSTFFPSMDYRGHNIPFSPEKEEAWVTYSSLFI